MLGGPAAPNDAVSTESPYFLQTVQHNDQEMWVLLCYLICKNKNTTFVSDYKLEIEADAEYFKKLAKTSTTKRKKLNDEMKNLIKQETFKNRNLKVSY